MKKEVVILTMSSKHKKYCVAGLDTSNGRWIRFVSNDETSRGALSGRDVIYENKTYCQPLDIVRITVLKELPIEYQPENVLIDSEIYWEKIGQLDINALLRTFPPETPSTILGSLASYAREAEMRQIGHSLVRIEATDLHVTHPEEYKTKASFIYNNNRYNNMSVTDPDFYKKPAFHAERALLIVSLPDTPFDVYGENRYYKFVAKIIPILAK